MSRLNHGIRMLPLTAMLALTLLLITACSALPDTTDINSGPPTPSPDTTIPTPANQGSIAQITPARAGSSMAYDQKRGEVILFGGDTTMDTWAWNGQTWDQLFPASVPPSRSGASMAYDAANDQIVLFGGISTGGYLLDDTWIWDGTNWLPASPTIAPSARMQASMTYDIAHQRIVLFGGMAVSAGQTPAVVADTWTWDGTNWTQMHPTISPSARSQASMTYDEAHKQVVLFGGFSGNSVMSDTWTWDETNWTQQHPRTNPVARAGASLVYDSFAQQLVLFAGVADPKVGDLHDMWQWDGNDWKQRAVQNVPSGFSTVATYDAIQQKIVVYVLSGANKVAGSSETWLWDGNAWMEFQ